MMLKKSISFTKNNNKSSFFLIILALIVGSVGASAAGLLNTESGGYLLCVNSKTKNVTYPGTQNCPKDTKKLVIGMSGPTGLNGVAGLNGENGRDGKDGVDGPKGNKGQAV